MSASQGHWDGQPAFWRSNVRLSATALLVILPGAPPGVLLIFPFWEVNFVAAGRDDPAVPSGKTSNQRRAESSRPINSVGLIEN